MKKKIIAGLLCGSLLLGGCGFSMENGFIHAIKEVDNEYFKTNVLYEETNEAGIHVLVIEDEVSKQRFLVIQGSYEPTVVPIASMVPAKFVVKEVNGTKEKYLDIDGILYKIAEE